MKRSAKTTPPTLTRALAILYGARASLTIDTDAKTIGAAAIRHAKACATGRAMVQQAIYAIYEHAKKHPTTSRKRRT